jgi:hypothetical protein
LSLLIADDPRFDLPDFKEFREDQLPLAEVAADYFASGVDVVIMEASVGFGKTLWSELVRQLRGRRTRMLYTTPLIYLQRQFIDSFPKSKLLMGRAKFPHGGKNGKRQFPELTCADCKNNYFCKEAEYCTYKQAKAEFARAQVGVTNSSYFLTAANYLRMFRPNTFTPNEENEGIPNQWTDDYLTVFDEAHKLESNMINFLGLTITQNYLRHVVEVTEINHKIPKPPTRDFCLWPDWWDKTLTLLRAGLKAYGTPARDDIQAIRWHTKLAKTILALEKVRFDWIYDPERGKSSKGFKTGEAYKVTLKPLLIGEQGNEILWRHCGKTICMSGSFVNAEVWAKSVGLKDSGLRYEFLKSEPKWDKWRRTIHRIPGIKMVKKEGTAWRDHPQWDDAIMETVKILDKYNMERTMIATVSHELSRDMGEDLAEIFGSRIIVNRGEKDKLNEDETEEEAAERLANSDTVKKYLARPATVLVTASIVEGADFYDDRCRNIIFARMPRPYLGDRRTKTILEETEDGQLYYMVQTVAAMLQISGRGCRHSLDFVRIWMLCQTFDGIFQMKGLLPHYYSSAVRPPGDYMSRFSPGSDGKAYG